jgi:hypothetical protein
MSASHCCGITARTQATSAGPFSIVTSFQNYLDVAVLSYQDALDPPANDPCSWDKQSQISPIELPLLCLRNSPKDNKDEEEGPPVPITNMVTIHLQELNTPTAKGLSKLFQVRFKGWPELARGPYLRRSIVMHRNSLSICLSFWMT